MYEGMNEKSTNRIKQFVVKPVTEGLNLSRHRSVSIGK